MKFIQYMAALGLTLALAACGGGGGSALLTPLALDIYLKDCIAGDQIKVTVTAPGLTKSVFFTVPAP